MTIDTVFFRKTAGQFATGVSVVTTCRQGAPAGLTVNAFCSVSLDPPLILVCIDLNSTTLPAIRESGIFAVNILTKDQERLSRCFATSSEERYQDFCHASFHSATTGAPVLDNVLAFIDARVVAEYPAGDHIIFLGQVEAMGTDGQIAVANDEDRQYATLQELDGDLRAEKIPLAYYRSEYRHLTSDYIKPSLVK